MPIARKSTEGSSRRRLGRGLESLVSKPVPIDVSRSESKETASKAPAGVVTQVVEPKASRSEQIASPATEANLSSMPGACVRDVAVASIHPNRHQPRQSIDDAGLESLAQSIKQSGLMQPVVVRPRKGATGEYELVAGERRWRAAQKIGLETIPAIVRNIDERAAAELALVENIQREDLNPIDRAEAFERLINEFDLTHQDLAERVGLDRSTITNFTRLTTLDEYSREMVRTGKISLGHAKVLLAITNDKMRAEYATRVVRQDWSVRELERQVKLLRDGTGESTTTLRAVRTQPAHLVDLERRLGEHLGTKVKIKVGAKKGTGSISIDFYTLEQFDGLMDQFGFAGEVGGAS